MQLTEWTISGRRVAQIALPLVVPLSVATVLLNGANGLACAVVGGVRLSLAGFGAGFRELEPDRARAAHSTGGNR
jgi:hypothetical protein